MPMGRLLLRSIIATMGFACFAHATLQAAEANRRSSTGLSRLDIASIVQQCNVDALELMSGGIFRERDPRPLLQEVASQWRRIGEARGETSSCLRKPEVQLYLADSLAQGVANGFDLDVDVRSVAAVLRAQVNSVDAALAFTAITGLSSIAEASDLKLFAGLIRSSTDSRRVAAIQALALHCSNEAAALLRAINDPNVQAEAAKHSAIRQVRCGNRN